MKNAWITIVALTSFMMVSEVLASPIIYTGINPEITPTANPNNEAAVANFANISKKQNTSSSASGAQTEAQLLKDSVISGLSSTYQQLLTSNCASCGGVVNFGDGSTATYSTANGTRTIVFHDLNGQTTTISFPLKLGI